MIRAFRTDSETVEIPSDAVFKITNIAFIITSENSLNKAVKIYGGMAKKAQSAQRGRYSGHFRNYKPAFFYRRRKSRINGARLWFAGGNGGFGNAFRQRDKTSEDRYRKI